MGRLTKVATPDAYRRLTLRPVVVFRGSVRPGNSGGPVVDRDGRVLATTFGWREGSDGGFAVPNLQVRNAMERIGSPV